MRRWPKRWRSELLSAPPSALESARALWAGPAAMRALASGSGGSVEIALAAGAYVRLSGDPPGWLLVAPSRAPRGPLTLLVGGLERAGPAPGAPVRVVRAARGGLSGALVIGSLRIGLDGAVACAASAPSPLRAGWRGALAAALGQLPGPPEELAGGLAALRRGALDEAVERLAGRGSGLTPAGDDVLAGFAAWRRADGAAPALAARAAGRSSPIGLAYLRCAERGEPPELADRALRAIREGDAGLAGIRARALSRWGASSGAAILWGIAAAAA
ncbi:MAG TPA: DUF2877 domain-containing protein [Solirubrobacteraceae bacterium]|nr:DUF2877 domain-containing protein [Solirubrobacteraceae bacterium]